MSIPLIRQLIREIKFSKTLKDAKWIKWKFDPSTLDRGFYHWGNIWSGIEKIGSYYFIIGADVTPSARRKVDFHFSVKQFINGKPESRNSANLTVSISDDVTSKDIEILRSVGDRLRKIIIDSIQNYPSQFENRVEFYDSLPPWRPGQWSVPATETGHADIIIGDRLDMGHFQFIVSKDPIIDQKWHSVILVCRKNLDLQGPREALMISKNKTFDEAKTAAETFINVESKRLDAENDQGRIEAYRDLMSILAKGYFTRW